MKNRSTSCRRLGAVVLAALLAAIFAGPLQAEEARAPLQVVEELARIAKDPDASWNDRWTAYAAAKDAITAEAEALAGQTDAQDEPVPHPAAARYEEIRGDVADALRREELPVSGWIMGFFAASLLWGGFAVCIAIARKSGKHVDPDAD